MKLNHLDLLVPDVHAAVDFFERHFDFEMCSNRASPAIAILSDRAGFTLVLQRKKRESEAYPEGFHIGFIVDDDETVRSAHARMVADGVASSGVIQNGRGVMFYCTAPGDITVEVSCRRDRG